MRKEKRNLRLGLVGESNILQKVYNESQYVNGIQIAGVYTEDTTSVQKILKVVPVYKSYEELLDNSDAVYIITSPKYHYQDIRCAIERGNHVLCESPIALSEKECEKLFALAKENKCVLMDAIKTAYSTAYHRMLLQVKSGKIGIPKSIEATCTSIRKIDSTDVSKLEKTWNSISAWGPTALLPVFQIFGTDYRDSRIITWLDNEKYHYDAFTKIDFCYPDSVASIKVGQGVKSEGELIISGTKGYIYVPAPWWKTEYYEIRYENQENNRRYFYQLEGEGIRYELVSFARSIESGRCMSNVEETISCKIAQIMEQFMNDEIIKI